MITRYGERNNLDIMKSYFFGSKIKLEKKYQTYDNKHKLPYGSIIGFIGDKIAAVVSHGKSLFVPISLTLLLKNHFNYIWYSNDKNFVNSVFKVHDRIVFNDNLYSKLKKSSKKACILFYAKYCKNK